MNQLVKEQINEYTQIQSGIHIALLGTTRGGKTTLATGGNSEPGSGLLGHFENVLVIDSTSDPGTISQYGRPVRKVGKIEGHRRLTVNSMGAESRAKIHKYLSKATAQGNIAIYLDEVRQLADPKFFRLGSVLDHLWLFTAKRGVSVIGGTQAPRWVPSAFYDQSKIHFIFGMRDRRAMKRLAEISGDVDTLETTIPTLERWQFAQVGTDGEVRISKFEMKSTPKKTSKDKQVPSESRVRILRA